MKVRELEGGVGDKGLQSFQDDAIYKCFKEITNSTYTLAVGLVDRSVKKINATWTL